MGFKLDSDKCSKTVRMALWKIGALLCLAACGSAATTNDSTFTVSDITESSQVVDSIETMPPQTAPCVLVTPNKNSGVNEDGLPIPTMPPAIMWEIEGDELTQQDLQRIQNENHMWADFPLVSVERIESGKLRVEATTGHFGERSVNYFVNSENGEVTWSLTISHFPSWNWECFKCDGLSELRPNNIEICQYNDGSYWSRDEFLFDLSSSMTEPKTELLAENFVDQIPA